MQKLLNQYDISPRYYSTKNNEIDFILQDEQKIIPVEVKRETDKDAPSFKKFIAEKSPDTAIRFSEMNYIETTLKTGKVHQTIKNSLKKVYQTLENSLEKVQNTKKMEIYHYV